MLRSVLALTAIISLASGIPNSAQAEGSPTFEQLEAAYKQGACKKAVAIANAILTSGKLDKSQLGETYFIRGHCLQSDSKMAEAIRDYQTSRLLGNRVPQTSFYISTILEADVPFRNPKEALRYMKQSAADGYCTAKLGLADYHATGEKGFQLDLKRSIQLLKETFEVDHKVARCGFGAFWAADNLAVAHAMGVGTAVDPVEARCWWKRKLDFLPKAAQSRLGYWNSGAKEETALFLAINKALFDWQLGEEFKLDTSVTEDPKQDLTEWPGPILQYYWGKIDLEALRKAAKNGPESFLSYRNCNIDYYAGYRALIDGKKKQSHKFFANYLKNDRCYGFQRALVAAQIKKSGLSAQ